MCFKVPHNHHQTTTPNHRCWKWMWGIIIEYLHSGQVRTKATLHSATRSMFFLDYNFCYSNIYKHIIWFGFSFTNLTKPEIDKLHSKMVKLPPMNMELFQQELGVIDENYPLSIPPSAILMVQIATGLILVTSIIIAIWQICKRKRNLSTLFKLAPEIKDIVTTNLDGFLNSLKSLLSNSSNQGFDLVVFHNCICILLYLCGPLVKSTFGFYLHIFT